MDSLATFLLNTSSLPLVLRYVGSYGGFRSRARERAPESLAMPCPVKGLAAFARASGFPVFAGDVPASPGFE